MVSWGEEWSWRTMLVRTRGTSGRQNRCCAYRGCSIVFAAVCSDWVSDIRGHGSGWRYRAGRCSRD
eukprot:3482066-Heterocapsa_arctica.AAC.1